MNFIKRSLEPTRKDEPKVVTIWFNAWLFENSKQIWAGLGHQIIKDIEANIFCLKRWFWQPLRYVWKNRRTELIGNLITLVLAMALAVIVLPALRTSLGETQRKDPFNFPVAIELLLPFAGGLAVFGFLAWRYQSILQPVSQRILEYAELPVYRDEMGYQHQVLNDIVLISEGLGKAETAPPVVVFVDDLDRCGEDKILEMLQAINLILGNCEIRKRKFFIVLGVAKKILEDAIKKNGKSDESDADAEKYLQKIIQLPFHLPQLDEARKENFIKELLKENLEERKDANEISILYNPYSPFALSLFKRTYISFTRYVSNLNYSRKMILSALQQKRLSFLHQISEVNNLYSPFITTRRLLSPVNFKPKQGDVNVTSECLKNLFDLKPEYLRLEHLRSPKWESVARYTDEEITTLSNHHEFLGKTPREIKRFINMHRLVKLLLQENYDLGWTKSQQEKLIKWLVLCDRWPNLVCKILDKAKHITITYNNVKQNYLKTFLEFEECDLNQGAKKEFKRFVEKEPELCLEELKSKDICIDFCLAAEFYLQVKESSAKQRNNTLVQDFLERQ
jgi:hypothetical protein